jgi:hypothetical protein
MEDKKEPIVFEKQDEIVLENKPDTDETEINDKETDVKSKNQNNKQEQSKEQKPKDNKARSQKSRQLLYGRLLKINKGK